MNRTWKRGDRVRVLQCANADLIGKTGTVVNTPAVGSPPLLRVRIDGSTETRRTEVDGTAEKFERLTADNRSPPIGPPGSTAPPNPPPQGGG